MNDPKLDSPSFHRNINPIMDLFSAIITNSKLKWLEIGSGSGQHVEVFANKFSEIEFQPTDIDPINLASIAAWTNTPELMHVREPSILDVTRHPWPFADDDRFDVFSAFNVIHISPWEVTKGIFEGAARLGSPECRVFLYGPFRINGEHTSQSNAEFDGWLKSKDERFGVRDIGDVCKIASQHEFELFAQHSMPANNFMMEFTHGPSS